MSGEGEIKKTLTEVRECVEVILKNNPHFVSEIKTKYLKKLETLQEDLNKSELKEKVKKCLCNLLNTLLITANSLEKKDVPSFRLKKGDITPASNVPGKYKNIIVELERLRNWDIDELKIFINDVIKIMQETKDYESR
jgi:hypothetical protein